MKTILQYVTAGSEDICENSARTCYESYVKNSESSKRKFITNLIKSGHMSVFEHATASFLIEGISRAASHQLVRHRMASYSQQSQRYVEEKNFDYVIPLSITKNPDAHILYNCTMNELQRSYQNLITLGIKKEDARFILPNAVATKLVMTANFRQWLHVIDMRVSRGAQWEIRDLLIDIWKQLYAQAPNIFGISYFESHSKDVEYKQNVFDMNIAV